MVQDDTQGDAERIEQALPGEVPRLDRGRHAATGYARGNRTDARRARQLQKLVWAVCDALLVHDLQGIGLARGSLAIVSGPCGIPYPKGGYDGRSTGYTWR